MMLQEKEIFALGASSQSSVIMPFFMENWMRERKKRKIKTKIIYNDTKEVRDSLGEKGKEKYFGKDWNYKFLHTNYVSNIMTVVFGNKVMLGSWKKDNPSAILIESKDIAETYKQHILNLWKIAKR